MAIVDDPGDGTAGNPGEQETQAPFAAPLRGIKITIRVYEPQQQAGPPGHGRAGFSGRLSWAPPWARLRCRCPLRREGEAPAEPGSADESSNPLFVGVRWTSFVNAFVRVLDRAVSFHKFESIVCVAQRELRPPGKNTANMEPLACPLLM